MEQDSESQTATGPHLTLAEIRDVVLSIGYLARRLSLADDSPVSRETPSRLRHRKFFRDKENATMRNVLRLLRDLDREEELDERSWQGGVLIEPTHEILKLARTKAKTEGWPAARLWFGSMVFHLFERFGIALDEHIVVKAVEQLDDEAFRVVRGSKDTARAILGAITGNAFSKGTNRNREADLDAGNSPAFLLPRLDDDHDFIEMPTKLAAFFLECTGFAPVAPQSYDHLAYLKKAVQAALVEVDQRLNKDVER